MLMSVQRVSITQEMVFTIVGDLEVDNGKIPSRCTGWKGSRAHTARYGRYSTVRWLECVSLEWDE